VLDYALPRSVGVGLTVYAIALLIAGIALAQKASAPAGLPICGRGGRDLELRTAVVRSVGVTCS
jgi:hypothetical protein